ncbi:MAG: HAD family hydrolase [Parvularculales bacterium]
MIKCLIFDYDGTLADTQDAIYEALIQVAKEYNARQPDFSEISSHIGLPLEKIIRDVLQIPEESVLESVKQYRKIYSAIDINLAKPFPDVIKTLNLLGSMGYSLTIASSKANEFIYRFLAKWEVEGIFDHVIGSQDVQNPKPDPEAVFTLARKTGIEPDDCLVIGDTVFDMQMGKRAGSRTCYARYGYGDDQLAGPFSDYIIKNFDEVLEILEK